MKARLDDDYPVYVLYITIGCTLLYFLGLGICGIMYLWTDNEKWMNIFNICGSGFEVFLIIVVLIFALIQIKQTKNN